MSDGNYKPALQECTNPNCGYKLQFDDYALGKAALFFGNCPLCGAVTVVFCPACKEMGVTKSFFDVCSCCGRSLRRLSKERRIELRDEAVRTSGAKNGRQLGPREIGVVRLLAEGRSNKEIAAAMSISIVTVESYRARIMLKVNAHCVAEVVRYAVQHKIIST
jgi:DNA-binding CsgD family transcriptional regulator